MKRLQLRCFHFIFCNIQQNKPLGSSSPFFHHYRCSFCLLVESPSWLFAQPYRASPFRTSQLSQGRPLENRLAERGVFVDHFCLLPPLVLPSCRNNNSRNYLPYWPPDELVPASARSPPPHELSHPHAHPHMRMCGGQRARLLMTSK